MGKITNLTVKGQVTIPKDVRDALGLLPGHAVEFELTVDGDAVIRKANDAGRLAARKAEIVKRVMEAREAFKHEDQMPGISSDEWYEMMRGPSAER